MMDESRKSFQERLRAFAEDERKKAQSLPAGSAKDLALQKINQAETAAQVDEWASVVQQQQ